MYFLCAYVHRCREKAWKNLETGESVEHSGNWGPGGHSMQAGWAGSEGL